MTLETKCFELRDEATFIPVMATRMVARVTRSEGISGAPEQLTRLAREAYLLRRAGYSPAHPLVVLCHAAPNAMPRQAAYDPHDWGGRTYPIAHQYITENWDSLESGAVIDVRHILGEADEPAVSEQFE